MFCVLLISNEVVAQEPDLIVTEISVLSSASTQQQVEVSWLVSNQGNGNILQRSWYDDLYLSADDKLDDSDTRLGKYPGGEKLLAGGSCTISVTFRVPKVPAGSYYLIVIADCDNNIYETDESNNIRSQLLEIRVPEEIAFTSLYIRVGILFPYQ